MDLRKRCITFGSTKPRRKMKLRILRDNGKYLIPKDSEIYNGVANYYTVNGVEFQRKYSAFQIDDPKEISRVYKDNVLRSYSTIEGGLITIADYNNTTETLKKDGGFYSDDEYSEWADIDKEYQYKKFTKNCTPNYEEVLRVTTWTEFEFIDVIASEHPSITPIEGIVSNISDVLFIFTPSKYDLLSAACEVTGYRFIPDKEFKASDNLRKTVSVSDHSNYDYLKINGDYVSDLKKAYFSTIRDTYEVCKAKRLDYINQIVRVIRKYDSMLSEKELDSSQLGFIIKSLNTIKSSAVQIESTKKGYDQKRSTLNYINQLISNLENISQNENS